MFRFIWNCRDLNNQFHVTGFFPYTLKTSEKHSFSDVFRGNRERPVAWKEFIWLLYDTLIAKLAAHGFRKMFFSIVIDYFKNPLHFIKIGLTFLSHFEIFRGISQGSIIGEILFTLFMNDLMFCINETEACNFADDYTKSTYSLN